MLAVADLLHEVLDLDRLGLVPTEPTMLVRTTWARSWAIMIASYQSVT